MLETGHLEPCGAIWRELHAGAAGTLKRHPAKRGKETEMNTQCVACEEAFGDGDEATYEAPPFSLDIDGVWHAPDFRPGVAVCGAKSAYPLPSSEASR